MKLLEDMILKYGQVYPGNILKVSSFLNHQVDASLLAEMGKEFKRIFEGDKVTKILTIESSGIAIAAFAAYEMGVPFVFAKKSQTTNISKEVYTARDGWTVRTLDGKPSAHYENTILITQEGIEILTL